MALTESQAADLVGAYRNEYLIRLEWKDGFLMFHDEGSTFRKALGFYTVKRPFRRSIRARQRHGFCQWFDPQTAL